jgi:hypothetical protein
MFLLCAHVSVLSYVGLPLHIFGKVSVICLSTSHHNNNQGSLFGPYTPLQQLDTLADHDTRSYVVGSTNSLLLAQKDRYCDVLVNVRCLFCRPLSDEDQLDENTINISSQNLHKISGLTVPDRRWIDFITQTVKDTWDEGT